HAAPFAIAIGRSAVVKQKQSIAIGSLVTADGKRSGYIGNWAGKRSGGTPVPAIVQGDGSYVIGNGNHVYGDNTFVLGNKVDIGSGSSGINNAVALGSQSDVAVAGGVALGSESV